MIYMDDKHFNILKNIFEKYNYHFYAFGSRVLGNHKKYSDIDIFFCENIPQKIIYSLEEEFEESDLPFKVDLIDYQKCDADFQTIMTRSYIQIQ
ncbi:MAG: nucleotidyltransferase domain-containing protein [Gammaproteobacteria bacterium]|nr:nucleotidyltransferase domain-containing protein [Gammaproteobacteria bacterium]